MIPCLISPEASGPEARHIFTWIEQHPDGRVKGWERKKQGGKENENEGWEERKGKKRSNIREKEIQAFKKSQCYISVCTLLFGYC